MSQGQYSHTTRSAGTVLTANIYNADHQNHITNLNPSMIGGYGDDVSQFQENTDPGEVGTESLPTTLADELKRIRNMIKQITGEDQWYETPVTSLAAVSGVGIPVLSKTSNYNVTSDDNGSLIAVNASGGAVNINLPDATANSGMTLQVFKGDSSANPVNIVRNGSDVINGVAANYVLTGNKDSVKFLVIGTSWVIIAHTNDAMVDPGTIQWVSEGTVKSGWLECNGQAISRTTYARLFGKISTTFGTGDGSTTFNVPNAQRRTFIGKGGTAVSGPANTLGATGGEETHTMTSGELVTHAHSSSGISVSPSGMTVSIKDARSSPGDSATATGLDNVGRVAAGTSDYGTTNTYTDVASVSGSLSVSGNTANAGSSTAFNVMQPSIVMMAIIKT